MTHFIGWWIGVGIGLTLYLILSLPLLIGMVIAAGRMRYREWVGVGVVLLAFFFLGFAADYVYNLLHWTRSHASIPSVIFTLAILTGNPVFLTWLVLTRSPWKKMWWVAIVVLSVGVGTKMVQEYRIRGERDQAAHARGLQPISVSASGPIFVYVIREDREPSPILWLQGNVARGTAVTLLADPFAAKFQAQTCTAMTGNYQPVHPDPAVPGNRTALESLKGCDRSTIYGAGVLGESVKTYQQSSSQEALQAARIVIGKMSPDKILRLNLFILNGQTYAAAVTEGPSQDAEGMNPTWIQWLLRLDGDRFTRLWPASEVGA